MYVSKISFLVDSDIEWIYFSVNMTYKKEVISKTLESSVLMGKDKKSLVFIQMETYFEKHVLCWKLGPLRFLFKNFPLWEFGTWLV